MEDGPQCKGGSANVCRSGVGVDEVFRDNGNHAYVSPDFAYVFKLNVAEVNGVAKGRFDSKNIPVGKFLGHSIIAHHAVWMLPI